MHSHRLLCNGTLTIFVQWTETAGKDTVGVVASFSGGWFSRYPESNMWSDGRCIYTSLEYQYAIVVTVGAGQCSGVEVAL